MKVKCFYNSEFMMLRNTFLKSCLIIFIATLTNSCGYEEYELETPTQVFDSNKKVLFIGVDGMRYDVVNETDMPYLWSFFNDDQSAYSFDGRNETMTLSAPNWSTLLTGVHWNKHKVIENDFLGEQLEKWPTIFRRLESHYINFETASIVHWEPINEVIIRNNVDTEVVADDEGVRDLANSILDHNDELDLMFIHLDDLDHAGHSYGFSPDVPEYAAAAASIDSKIESIITALKERRFYEEEEWLIVVTTDHGGEGFGHGNTPFVPTSLNIRKIPMVFNSATITPGEIEGNPNAVDVATTILNYFGLNFNELDGEAIL